jgi:hypothetical protein
MSFASQFTHQRFPFAYNYVFAAVTAMLPQCGFTINSQDKVIGRISASAPMSAFSWGENISLVVEQIDETNTMVSIDSSLKVGFNLAGAHRHKNNFETIIRNVC